MRYSEAGCRHVAEILATVLSEKKLVHFRTDKQAVVEKITAALLDNFRQEEALEQEAERLAEEHLRAAVQVDRRRVTQLIKQRLAEERKFVL